jgi:hypothetical protein
MREFTISLKAFLRLPIALHLRIQNWQGLASEIATTYMARVRRFSKPGD